MSHKLPSTLIGDCNEHCAALMVEKLTITMTSVARYLNPEGEIFLMNNHPKVPHQTLKFCEKFTLYIIFFLSELTFLMLKTFIIKHTRKFCTNH